MTGRPPMAGTVTLTSPDGVRRAHGADLDDWDAVRDYLVARACGDGWVGPYVIAPAPGNPAGVTVAGLPLPARTWAEIDHRWWDRRVMVRWEDGTDVGPDGKSGRPHVLSGVVVLSTDDRFRLTVRHPITGRDDVVDPPGHAHVVERSAADRSAT